MKRGKKIKIWEKQMSVTLKRQERNEKRNEWKEKPIMKENEISCLKEMNSISHVSKIEEIGK